MTELWNRVAGDETLVLVTNVLVQITLLTALALIVARLFRRNATVRHCILLSAMLSVSAVPVLTVVLQQARLSVVAIPVTWNSTDSVPPAATPEVDVPPVVIVPYGEEEVEASGDTRIDATDESALPSLSNEWNGTEVAGLVHRDRFRSAVAMVLLIWLLGGLVALVGIARSDWKLRRIVRRARPLDLDKHRGVVDEVCRILGIKSLPQLACSSNVAGPTVAGVVRPLIILPTRLVDVLSTSELRDVLLHETAHVLRRDQLVALLQQMLGAIFWPHPLVHLLNRRLACAREDVCDNYVLAAVDPADYGETLLRLGQLMPQSRLQTSSVGMFNTHWKLEDRIADLLDKRRNAMIRLRLTSTAAIVVSTLVLSLAVAGSRIAWADTPPPPGERNGQGSQSIHVDEVSQAVDRMVAFLQSFQQRGEQTSAEAHSSLVVEGVTDSETAKSESRENVSKAVGRMVELLRQRAVQDATATERLGLYAINVINGEVTLVRDKPLGDLTYFGSPSWSNDGRRILFDATPGKTWHKTRLEMIDVTQRRALLKDLGAGNCPALSPDGKRIVFLLNSGAVPGSQPGVWIMHADGTKRRRLGGFGIPKWSPDGRQLLIVSFSSPCRLTLMDVETGEERPVKLTGDRIYSVPSWAGDGQTIVALVGTGSDAGIALVDVTDPEQTRVKQVLWRKGDRLAVQPSYPVYSAKTGHCVFVGKDENGAALYTVQPGQFNPPKRLEPSGYDGKIASLAFSPDGRYVLFCSDRLNQLQRGQFAPATAREDLK